MSGWQESEERDAERQQEQGEPATTFYAVHAPHLGNEQQYVRYASVEEAEAAAKRYAIVGGGKYAVIYRCEAVTGVRFTPGYDWKTYR